MTESLIRRAARKNRILFRFSDIVPVDFPALESLVPVTGFACRAVKFGAGDCRKTFRKDFGTVGNLGGDGASRLIQREVVAAIRFFAGTRQKIESVVRIFQIAFLRECGVVKHCEQIDFAPLHPHVFVRVVNCSVAFETGQKTSIFRVNAVLLPERDNRVQKFRFITFCSFFEK